MERQKKTGFFSKLKRVIAGRKKVDDDFLDSVEEVLLTSDVGLDTTVKIVEAIEHKAEVSRADTEDELMAIVKDSVSSIFDHQESYNSNRFLPAERPSPYVLMVVGVNGVGKTTTIGKLAYRLQKQGLSVVLGAADTFRAAAVAQLRIWADRSGADFVEKGQNADPASVAFDAINAGKARNADVIIIDTAGRLHNQVGLMNELTKIRKVMDRGIPGAPHDVMLVLDASTGQNAFEQAKQFIKATDVSCLALTKMDGTAKGGVALGITDQFSIPIRYMGLGEGEEDLMPFDVNYFIDSMFKEML
ncbi:MAG: signal recognition particle-docking protein FtsY [Saprospirales bacterium TMED214]|nr:MAG: signal recognition particle-docking protein FtsY [Saprospirales bacterium TMED214]